MKVKDRVYLASQHLAQSSGESLINIESINVLSVLVDEIVGYYIDKNNDNTYSPDNDTLITNNLIKADLGENVSIQYSGDTYNHILSVNKDYIQQNYKDKIVNKNISYDGGAPEEKEVLFINFNEINDLFLPFTPTPELPPTKVTYSVDQFMITAVSNIETVEGKELTPNDDGSLKQIKIKLKNPPNNVSDIKVEKSENLRKWTPIQIKSFSSTDKDYTYVHSIDISKNKEFFRVRDNLTKKICVPYGYEKHSIYRGGETLIGLRLHNPPVASGTFDSLDGSSCQGCQQSLGDSNANFNELLKNGKRYLVENVNSESESVGLVLEVDSWTNKKLDVEGVLQSDVGDYVIRPAMTIYDIFGENNSVGLTGSPNADINEASTISIPIVGAFKQIFLSSLPGLSGWIDSASFTSANTLSLNYIDGIIIYEPKPAAEDTKKNLTLYVSGIIKTTSTVLPIDSINTYLGSVYPVGSNLSNSGIYSGMVADTDGFFPGSGDHIYMPQSGVGYMGLVEGTPSTVMEKIKKFKDPPGVIKNPPKWNDKTVIGGLESLGWTLGAKGYDGGLRKYYYSNFSLSTGFIRYETFMISWIKYLEERFDIKKNTSDESWVSLYERLNNIENLSGITITREGIHYLDKRIAEIYNFSFDNRPNVIQLSGYLDKMFANDEELTSGIVIDQLGTGKAYNTTLSPPGFYSDYTHGSYLELSTKAPTTKAPTTKTPTKVPSTVLHLDAKTLIKNEVKEWGTLTATGNPKLHKNQTPNGGSAVMFDGNDHFGKIKIPFSDKNDFLLAAVLKPEKSSNYHCVFEKTDKKGPQLWIGTWNNKQSYEGNGGGEKAPTNNGKNGWDIVILDSKQGKLYHIDGTNQVQLASQVKNWQKVEEQKEGEISLFNAGDGFNTYIGLVAELRVYNDASAFNGDYTSLYNELYSKWMVQ